MCLVVAHSGFPVVTVAACFPVFCLRVKVATLTPIVQMEPRWRSASPHCFHLGNHGPQPGKRVGCHPYGLLVRDENSHKTVPTSSMMTCHLSKPTNLPLRIPFIRATQEKKRSQLREFYLGSSTAYGTGCHCTPISQQSRRSFRSRSTWRTYLDS